MWDRMIKDKTFYRDHYCNDPQLVITDRVSIVNCTFTTKNPVGHIIFSEPGNGPCILIK